MLMRDHTVLLAIVPNHVYKQMQWSMPSVLWRCWLDSKPGHPACKKTEWWDAGVVMYLGQGADLHMAQLMPLPLTISCSSKSRLVLPFWCQLTRVVPDKIQESRKMVLYVCDRMSWFARPYDSQPLQYWLPWHRVTSLMHQIPSLLHQTTTTKETKV